MQIHSFEKFAGQIKRWAKVMEEALSKSHWQGDAGIFTPTSESQNNIFFSIRKI